MFRRRLCLAIAVAVAFLIGPSGQVGHRAADIRSDGAAGLMATVLPGGAYALAADEASGSRGPRAELAQADGGAPAAERPRPVEGRQAPAGAEGGVRGAAATAGAQGAAPAPRFGRQRQDAGDLIAQAIAPVDDTIRANGLAFRSSHFAEDCRDWPAGGYPYYQGHASRFVFAIEVADGVCSEYSLCAAQGPDGQYGLYVSVCEYRAVTEQREGKDGKPEPYHRVVIDRIYLVRADALSLALRAQILDEISQGNFMRAYQQYVRQHQAGEAAESVVRPWLQTGAE